MNYIEWVLLRGTELWREREKTLRERLSRPAAKSIGAAEKNGDAADGGEEATPVQSGRAESAAVWLRQELGKNMTAAAGIAAAKERDAFTLSQEREMRETEAFSQSLERDARRYDGGFLFY